MLQGPISTCKEIIIQFRNIKNRKMNYENILSGLYLFMFGVSEKIIIADKFGNATDWAFRHLASLDTTNMIVAVLSYTFQIFFDFDGYSNMAVGISKMFSIELIDNFDSPYLALSIPQFWKKWHISLTKFFTKCVYIPLGGNRKGFVRTLINTMIVFVLSGIWHGASWNFVIWGLLNGLLVCLGKFLSSRTNKIPKIVNWLITFIMINFLWVVFRANSLDEVMIIVKSILSLNFGSLLDDLIVCYGISEIDFVPYDLNLIRMFKASRFYIAFYFMLCAVVIYYEKKIKQDILKNRLNVFIKTIIIFFFMYCVLSFTNNYTFIYAGF